MTDRVLSMLYQYLLSYQSLELNETFQVYLKILSVEHSKFKGIQRPKKVVKKIGKKIHLGQSERSYNYPWAIDVPSRGVFINNCLLTCFILALAQHEYFENRKNRLFLNLSLLKSSIETKKQYALKILETELS